jgi:hypothetical protein
LTSPQTADTFTRKPNARAKRLTASTPFTTAPAWRTPVDQGGFRDKEVQMNGYDYILAKQIAWATNRGIPLVGSKVARGRPAYARSLDQNLFQPLQKEVKAQFAAGDGGELGSRGLPGKMQAVHSSSALGVNVFQYWLSNAAVPTIAAACGLCRQGSLVSCDIRFEEKYPIDDSFGRHPNLDVVIHNQQETEIKRFAIECKFSEAYVAHRHAGIKPKYLNIGDIWDDIPRLRDLAEGIFPDDKKFIYLDHDQLIKHILGLKRSSGRSGFRLLYLWYDVLGEQGKLHRDETARFAKVAKDDGIMFHSLTYQELIVRMADQFRSSHGEYIQYLTERYL